MRLHFSLADKLSASIILAGVLCILLVYYISNSYKQLAYQHHDQAIKQLATLEVNELIEKLRSNSLDLALAIEHESDFKQDVHLRRKKNIEQQLNNQFNQYFVTAGVLKLLKLYVMDTEFNLISMSTDGIAADIDSGLICPKLSQTALTRKGSEQLQTLSTFCLFSNIPVFSVLVPFGGLNPDGYIQVVTDLAYNLREVEQSLAMPIRLKTVDDQLLYQSSTWPLNRPDHGLEVTSPLLNDENERIMYIILKADMSTFNNEITRHRNWVMGLTFITTGLIVLILLLVLRKSSVPPLAKIYDVLEQIHLQEMTDSESSRTLFEQLLDQIIQLREKNRSRFSVMILDLNNFRKVNAEYGEDSGDKLLIEVEHRLSSVLRGTDMISWVGTDSPGHKLMPVDTKTQYRATIARLGGDEFGLLLPSVENAEEANAVAERIVNSLTEPFRINKHIIDINCKIGISIFPLHGEDENVLIRNADKAMYQAKAFDKPAFVFNPDL